MSKKITKRALAGFLALLLVVLMMPVMAFAENYVCKIGDTGYATLEQAIADAKDNDTIKLFEGIFDGCFYVNKNINLTFEGTLSESGDILTTFNVKQDSKGNGNGALSFTEANQNKTFTVKNINFTNTNSVTASKAVNLWAGGSGTVTIENCIMASEMRYMTTFMGNKWNVSIKNCTINCSEDKEPIAIDGAPKEATDKPLVLSNNVFNNVWNSTLVGGYPQNVDSSNNVIYLADDIDGQDNSKYLEYLPKLIARISSKDTIKIKKGQDIVLILLGDRGDYKAKIESAGTLKISEKNGVGQTYVVSSPLSTLNNGTISITGGIYSYDPSNYGDNHINYIAEGYEAIKNMPVTGKWTVKPARPIINIDSSVKYDTLHEAVNDAKDGETIKLLDNVDLVENVTVDKGREITIDMNGKTIKQTVGKSIFIDGTNTTGNELTLTGKGNIIGCDATPFKVIYLKGSTEDKANTATLNIGKDITVLAEQAGYAVMISANGNSAYGVKVNIEGTVSGAYAALYVNGTISKDSGNVPIFNIKKGAKLINSTDDGAAIYAAGFAKWNFDDGCEVIGPTAVYMKAGNMVSIKGGTFIANGAKAEYVFSSNGFEATGDAFVIENCNYPGGVPQIKIAGGLFKSKNAEAIASYCGNEITNPVKEFILDGYFSSKPKAEYVAVGYEVIKNDGSEVSNTDYPYTIGHTVTFDSNGGTLEPQKIGVRHNNTVLKDAVKTPKKDNYSFVGWVDASGKQFLFDTPITKNITIKANWLSDDAKGEITVKDTEKGIKAQTSIKKSDIPLTEKEVSDIESGKVLDVNLVVEVKEAKVVEEKELIKESMKENQKLGMYLDCSMFKTLDGKPVGQIYETLNPITIVLTVPEKLREDGRVYSIIRVHNNEVETLFEGKADKDWNISFETDKFSTYAIVYEGGTPKTGDNNNAILFACLGVLALLGISTIAGVVLKKKTYR